MQELTELNALDEALDSKLQVLRDKFNLDISVHIMWNKEIAVEVLTQDPNRDGFFANFYFQPDVELDEVFQHTEKMCLEVTLAKFDKPRSRDTYWSLSDYGTIIGERKTYGIP